MYFLLEIGIVYRYTYIYIYSIAVLVYQRVHSHFWFTNLLVTVFQRLQPTCAFRHTFQRPLKVVPNEAPFKVAAEGVLALTPHEIDQYEYSNDGFALAGVTWL